MMKLLDAIRTPLEVAYLNSLMTPSGDHYVAKIPFDVTRMLTDHHIRIPLPFIIRSLDVIKMSPEFIMMSPQCTNDVI